MPEFARLSDGSDCIELAFIDREAKPEPLMLMGLSI